MLAGGKGTISVTANAAPNLMHRMCKAAVAGDEKVATALDEQLSDLHVAMFLESNPIPAKWAVQQLGLASEGIRLPLLTLSEEYHDTVRAAMQRAEVL
jgi:4-hydroxy-tetrahydrodipicolinate synthase